MIFTRTIVDLYHGDTVDLPLMANNGACGVIHKATQGSAIKDAAYATRRAVAAGLGLLFGSYHFADQSDPVAQVDHWLSVANPSEADVLALDWEENGGNTATISQVCQMVQRLFEVTKRYPLLYGSNMLQERIPTKGAEILFNCPLWIASYTASPKIPKGWDKYTLWQYTGDGQGPVQPHIFPGAGNSLDISQFDGTIDELIKAWPFNSF